MKHTLLLFALLLGISSWAAPQAAAADEATSTRQTSRTARTGARQATRQSATRQSTTRQNTTRQNTRRSERNTTAQDEAPAQELSVVATALKNAEYLTSARPNLNAKFFIILRSASWCGPCRNEMPRIAAEYANIRRSGQVELILHSQDNTAEDAVKFVTSNNGNFPVIAKDKMPQLPNMPQTPGIPWAIFMDANGNVVTSQHGSSVMQWRNHTIKDAPDVEIPGDADAGEDSEPERPTVAEALREVEFISGRPRTNARYYIFLHSASWCGPCRALMPQIVAEYRKLRNKKVEIILVSGDRTVEDAKAYVRDHEVRFPAAMPAAVANVPGYQPPGAYPSAVIVDNTGRVIQQGHGRIVLDCINILREDARNNRANRQN